jgi:flagellar motor switch protein FliN/FliY
MISTMITTRRKPTPSSPPGAALPQILRLEVPLVVRLGERKLGLQEVVSLLPGAILELPKNAEEELEILVNNRVIGRGAAVKVGENFGIRITAIGPVKDRIEAMGPGGA